DSEATTYIPKDKLPSEFQNQGPWKLVKELGRGATGITYLGLHTSHGSQAAIKVPYPHLHKDQEFLARFRQEARLGQRLDHPGIVRIVDPGPEAGLPWLAMEFVDGESLDHHLIRRRA